MERDRLQKQEEIQEKGAEILGETSQRRAGLFLAHLDAARLAATIVARYVGYPLIRNTMEMQLPMHLQYSEQDW